MGKAESVTTFDTEYETLSQQLEAIRASTEKIVGHVQTLIQPNPGERLSTAVVPCVVPGGMVWYIVVVTLLPNAIYKKWACAST